MINLLTTKAPGGVLGDIPLNCDVDEAVEAALRLLRSNCSLLDMCPPFETVEIGGWTGEFTRAVATAFPELFLAGGADTARCRVVERERLRLTAALDGIS